MPVQTRALDCSCGERMLATSDEGLGKAIKDHINGSHPDREDLSLERAVEIARTDGFDPQGGGGGSVDLSISR